MDSKWRSIGDRIDFSDAYFSNFRVSCYDDYGMDLLSGGDLPCSYHPKGNNLIMGHLNRFAEISGDILVELYRKMVLLRRFEEKIIEVYPQQEMKTPVKSVK